MRTVKDYLLYEAKVGDVIIFRDGGWQIGCTRIDNDWLFMCSLNPTMLRREVLRAEYGERDWINCKVLVIDI